MKEFVHLPKSIGYLSIAGQWNENHYNQIFLSRKHSCMIMLINGNRKPLYELYQVLLKQIFIASRYLYNNTRRPNTLLGSLASMLKPRRWNLCPYHGERSLKTSVRAIFEILKIKENIGEKAKISKNSHVQYECIMNSINTDTGSWAMQTGSHCHCCGAILCFLETTV